MLRVVLCNPSASAVVNAVKRNRSAAGFQPGSDHKAAWPAFAPMGELWSQTLPEAAEHGGLKPLRDLVDRLTQLQQDDRFRALEERRGMDYHRHQPQSVDHASPRSGVSSSAPDGMVSRIDIPTAQSDARGGERFVCRICVDALGCVADCVCETEALLVPKLAACDVAWRPAATRSL